ncbi:MAG: putative quinol monooxygenase [Croceibacterium sp.]
MFAVLGSFRFPPESLERAMPQMQALIAATLTERGCRTYAYSEDVADPGLFRVIELWDTREQLAAHFETPHMQVWIEQREALGFYDREVEVHEIGATESL